MSAHEATVVKRMYRLPEVANRLDVSLITVYRLVNKGALERVHVMGMAFVTAGELDRYLSTLEVPPHKGRHRA